MKKLFFFFLSLWLSVFLVACQPTDQELLKDFLDDVKVSYRGSDTKDAVTESIDLTEELEGVEISWTSSHPTIISSSGVVVRPDVDTEVTLTATVTLGKASETLTFVMTVKAVEIVIHPLEQALTNMNALTSYTMTIQFTSNENTYPVVVKMGETTASVEALGETVYYEVDGETCYIYELDSAVWTKNEVTCSEKGTSELSFLTNFSKDYFVEQTLDQVTYYVLKMEYYTQLQSFLNSSITSNFKMTLEAGYIRTIDMMMTRDSITFNVSIVLSLYNQTTITLPVISS